MHTRSLKLGLYLVVLLFALFVFIVNEKIALMVVGGIGVIVLVLWVIKYVLVYFDKTKKNEK